MALFRDLGHNLGWIFTFQSFLKYHQSLFKWNVECVKFWEPRKGSNLTWTVEKCVVTHLLIINRKYLYIYTKHEGFQVGLNFEYFHTPGFLINRYEDTLCFLVWISKRNIRCDSKKFFFSSINLKFLKLSSSICGRLNLQSTYLKVKITFSLWNEIKEIFKLEAPASHCF